LAQCVGLTNSAGYTCCIPANRRQGGFVALASHGLTNWIDFNNTTKASPNQGLKPTGKRQTAAAGRQPLLISTQRPMTIGNADMADVASEVVAVTKGCCVICISPEVDRQSDLGVINRFNDINGLRKRGQKSTARGSRFTNRLDR
jgi:hypothetical protein